MTVISTEDDHVSASQDEDLHTGEYTAGASSQRDEQESRTGLGYNCVCMHRCPLQSSSMCHPPLYISFSIQRRKHILFHTETRLTYRDTSICLYQCLCMRVSGQKEVDACGARLALDCSRRCMQLVDVVVLGLPTLFSCLSKKAISWCKV